LIGPEGADDWRQGKNGGTLGCLCIGDGYTRIRLAGCVRAVNHHSRSNGCGQSGGSVNAGSPVLYARATERWRELDEIVGSNPKALLTISQAELLRVRRRRDDPIYDFHDVAMNE
jgi:hypothetical protein